MNNFTRAKCYPIMYPNLFRCFVITIPSFISVYTLQIVEGGYKNLLEKHKQIPAKKSLKAE